MNVFLDTEIASNYDDYYQSDFGKKIDIIEQEIISNLIKGIPTNEMLELGCGTGHWTDFFNNKGFSITGIDISGAMLNIAKSKNINAKFKIANSENLPFDNESFKCVSSITMLEFVDNQEKVIDEIYRVLKKDAWLILACLNENSILGKNKENNPTFKNANFFTIDSLKSKLDKFEIISIKSGVYLKSDNTIIDNNEDKESVEPVFIGLIAQKK